MRTFPMVLLLTGCVPHLYSEGSELLPWEAPANSWPINDPPADLVGVGWEVGQVPPDFRLTDQLGDEVSLWQFYGDVVVVDVSTMWCAPCQDLALGTEETWHDYRDDGFVYLTVLQQDVHNEPPDLEDLNQWGDAYGITSPILADGDQKGTGAAVKQGQYPAVLLLGRDMTVVERVNPASDEALREAIEAHL